MYELEIKSLNKKYRDKHALKDCSFKVCSGEVVGIIGKNGAGKTTLFNLIAGNIIATSGEIFFDKEEVLSDSDVRKDFGVLIKPALYEQMKGYEFLSIIDSLNARPHSRKEIANTLDIVGLNNAKQKLIKSYSFGMRQRLCFANALLGANKLLMLDEPFVGLDVNGRKIVKNHILEISKDNGIPIIFSDHNLDEVMDLCTRVILLNNGEIVYDGALDTFKQDITITVNDTKDIDAKLFTVLNSKQLVAKKSNLDKSLRTILEYTEIENVENINVLNSLLDNGGKYA